jgi:hypothetical protein
VRLAALFLAASLLLVGCGGQDATGRVAAAGDDVVRDVLSEGPSAQPVARSEEKPSLPPGDPGLDAPAVPDPGTASAEPHGHGEARRTVPVAAMLTADTVGMVLGGVWDRHQGGGDECVRPSGGLGVRTMSYGGAVEGLVVETVATYEDADAADAAVAALAAEASRCGWDGDPDPRLGSASAAATEGARSMLAVSAEGVLVLLVGTGELTANKARWGSLVDLALGSSCPAAPDGCH